MLSQKPIIVAKFGGTSVGSIERIQNVGRIIQELQKEYQPVIVVSAMSGVTNTLSSYCNDIAPQKQDEEFNTVLAAGEQITSGLLALQLKQLGLKSHSYMGWQIRIQTNNISTYGQIESIDTTLLWQDIQNNTIPVIAGFQGITNKNRINTLGRGGSDTTAVAVAAALQNESQQNVDCYIYTDVDGVYSADPRFVQDAQKLEKIPTSLMIALAHGGSKVLDMRSVQLAQKHQINLFVKSSFTEDDNNSGTYIYFMKEELMENAEIYGITHDQSEYLFHIEGEMVKIYDFLNALSQKNIRTNLLTIVHTENNKQSIQVMIAIQSLQRVEDLLNAKLLTYTIDKHKTKISIVGTALQSDSRVLKELYDYVEQHHITIDLLNISPLVIAFVMSEQHTIHMVNYLHNQLVHKK